MVRTFPSQKTEGVRKKYGARIQGLLSMGWWVIWAMTGSGTRQEKCDFLVAPHRGFACLHLSSPIYWKYSRVRSAIKLFAGGTASHFIETGVPNGTHRVRRWLGGGWKHYIPRAHLSSSTAGLGCNQKETFKNCSHMLLRELTSQHLRESE